MTQSAFIKADRTDLNILFLFCPRGNIGGVMANGSVTDMSGELRDENEKFRIKN
jgi:hypothetical protein